MKKVIHLPAACIGCLACTSIAPELFTVDEVKGISKLIEGSSEGEQVTREVSDDQVPDLLVDTCPASAIQVEEI